MALDDPAHAGLLACGAALDDLIAQVIDGAAPIDQAHQAACRYCQLALDAVREAWEQLQEAARTLVAVPDDLTERVMSRIRSLSRPSDSGVMLVAPEGDTHIAQSVLGQLSRAAALEVEHVRWVSVLSAEEDPEQFGSGVSVVLRVVAAYGPALPALAAQVREQVRQALRRDAGVEDVTVDVMVEDIVVDDDDQKF